MSIAKKTWKIFKDVCLWAFITMIFLAVTSFTIGFFTMAVGDFFDLPRVFSIGRWMVLIPIMLGIITMIIGVISIRDNGSGSGGGGATWTSASGPSGGHDDSGPTPGYGGSI
jgi:hypothetical protein